MMRGTVRVWRMLLLSQFREQPTRLTVTVLAIALGVALCAAVYLINGSALTEFTQATKRLVGEADVIVRGPPAGFPESLFVALARDPEVRVASPMLELEVALPGRRDPLKVLAVDPFRARELQASLIADIGPHVLSLLQPNSLYLSGAAAREMRLAPGDSLAVTVGDAVRHLYIVGILSPDAYSQPLGLMDIASAQQLFERIGRLNRIDLRLREGVDARLFRRTLAQRLPAGVAAISPEVELNRAATVTRAYRVNLNMLALVALWTGAFLVFATQTLSVLRRRGSLALLRALGVTRGELERALIGEGAALGALGALLGVILGALLASILLRVLAGDLGNKQLHAVGASLGDRPWAMAGFFAIGVLVSACGAWLPARAGARLAPARALKSGGGGNLSAAASAGSRSGFVLLACGAGLAWLPPIAGLPLFGYAAVGALLFGSILLIPGLTVKLLRAAPQTGRVVVDTAVAQLKDNVGVSTLSLASIIVSFSLMVAMAIMVFSFRVSFEHWLGQLLPAEVQMRVPPGNDTAFWSSELQARVAGVAGISRIDFRRTRPILLDASHAPAMLIARDISVDSAPRVLPLVAAQSPPPAALSRPAWISEAMQTLYGYGIGDPLNLPLGGRLRRFIVAGVWRDYARSTGAIVIDRADYIAATGDGTATEASIWLRTGGSATAVVSAVRRLFAQPDALEILMTSAVREHSLQIFDRAFAVTYALEAVAVLIGLAGVSFAASATALARRAEFGMLRHVGFKRRQIVALLACEGILMSTLGVLYGLALGGLLSLVLVYVVNRQSFNWSIDLAVPYWQLAVLGATLIAASAATAVWSGRAAASDDPLRAVREDW